MSAKEKAKPDTEFQILSIDDIRSSTLNPRQIFEKEPLENLADSIKEDGLIEPIVVRPLDKGYEIVVGERRYRASKLAGKKEIPSLIRDLPDEKVLELMLVENILREDIQPIEEAITYKRLIDDHDYTQQRLAVIVKKSQQKISETISLLKLPEEVQRHIVGAPNRVAVKGAIPATHAYEIYRLGEEERQKTLAKKIIRKGMTKDKVLADVRKVKAIDKLVETVPSKKARKVLKEKLEPTLFNDETTITKVKKEVELATRGFIKEPSFEDQWNSKILGMKAIHDRHQQTSFLREWEEGDRKYFQLVLWMDKGEKIPKMIRKDYPITDFATFEEADEYAKARGGYSSGKIRIRNEEYWCIYEREDKDELRAQADNEEIVGSGSL